MASFINAPVFATLVGGIEAYSSQRSGSAVLQCHVLRQLRSAKELRMLVASPALRKRDLFVWVSVPMPPSDVFGQLRSRGLHIIVYRRATHGAQDPSAFSAQRFPQITALCAL